jgi:hypothetical protein
MESQLMKKSIFILMFSICILGNASAATYYIDPTAGSGGNGSASNPFDSWSDLPSVNTGDDVYIRCDRTLTTPSDGIDINWNGTSSNRAIIGAYYMDGQTPVHGISGSKPAISGSNHARPSGTVPVYQGLIDVINRDYVTIENLKIEESRGHGIRFEGENMDNESSEYFIIDNCDVISNYMSGVTLTSSPP